MKKPANPSRPFHENRVLWEHFLNNCSFGRAVMGHLTDNRAQVLLSYIRMAEKHLRRGHLNAEQESPILIGSGNWTDLDTMVPTEVLSMSTKILNTCVQADKQNTEARTPWGRYLARRKVKSAFNV